MVRKNELLITREFNAPRELVFKAWSEAERLAKWWGPTGFSIEVKNLDFRTGGHFHFAMKNKDTVMWAKFIYRDVQAPERIVFVNSFSDEHGNIVPPPFPDPWPTEMLNTVRFTEQNGKTTLHLSVIAINATAEQERTFLAGHPSMQEGYGGTFDQLDEYLVNFEFYFVPGNK